MKKLEKMFQKLNIQRLLKKKFFFNFSKFFSVSKIRQNVIFNFFNIRPVFLINNSHFSERIFPPLNGFSFCTWIYLDCLSDKKADAHPIRLLTVTRAVAGADGKKTAHLACFQVQFSAFDRSLLISTEESDQPGADLEKIANFQTDKVISKKKFYFQFSNIDKVIY